MEMNTELTSLVENFETCVSSEEGILCVYLYLLCIMFQIGKEHSGLKAVTEILQDIQYKVKLLILLSKNVLK